VIHIPDGQANLPANTAACLPLSERHRLLFLFQWALIAYVMIAANVIVLMLLGVEILVAEAVALAVGFAVAEIALRMTGKITASVRRPDQIHGLRGPWFAG